MSNWYCTSPSSLVWMSRYPDNKRIKERDNSEMLISTFVKNAKKKVLSAGRTHCSRMMTKKIKDGQTCG